MAPASRIRNHVASSEHFMMEASSGVTVRHWLVTPEIAAEWLKLNGNNRRVDGRRVAFLAQQILDGNWALTHQGIAFWDDGTLADGQHRLMAIVKSGVAVKMLVTRGIAKPAIHAIDIVRPRSTQNVLHFLGMPVSCQTVSCARIMFVQREMTKQGNASWPGGQIPTEKFACFLAFAMEAIEFGYVKHSKGVGHSCVQASIASAWFTQDRDRLARFKNILCEGVDAASDESAAMRLRDFLMTTHLTVGGQLQRQELFRRCCTAIRAFLECRPLSKLYCRADAAFDIPDDPC